MHLFVANIQDEVTEHINIRRKRAQLLVRWARSVAQVEFLLSSGYLSLMHCLLDYCNALYTGLPASTLALFQRVLHAAARLVLNLRPRDHVSAALKELHWLSVAQQIDYKLCLLVHKSSRNQALEYVSNMLKPAANDPQLTTLRTAANGNYVVVPRTNCRLDDRAFSVAAPKAWNSLPTDLKTATCSTDAFKRRLKTWLFKMAYD